MNVIAHNRRARFDYELLEKFEAGLVLSGQEVKSVKTGHMSLKGAFVTLRGQEAFLTNSLIPKYAHADTQSEIREYDPNGPRKLLLHKKELKRLIGKVKVEGLTLVPTRVYIVKGLIKLEFFVGKGKKKHDKRDSLAKKDSQRKIDRALKSR